MLVASATPMSKKGSHLKQRIDVKLADTSLPPSLGEQIPEVRSAYCSRIAAFPNIVIGSGVGAAIKQPLFVQHVREERVMLPVSLNHDGVVGLLLA